MRVLPSDRNPNPGLATSADAAHDPMHLGNHLSSWRCRDGPASQWAVMNPVDFPPAGIAAPVVPGYNNPRGRPPGGSISRAEKVVEQIFQDDPLCPLTIVEVAGAIEQLIPGSDHRWCYDMARSGVRTLQRRGRIINIGGRPRTYGLARSVVVTARLELIGALTGGAHKLAQLSKAPRCPHGFTQSAPLQRHLRRATESLLEWLEINSIYAFDSLGRLLGPRTPIRPVGTSMGLSRGRNPLEGFQK